jgi:hypothetical protein
MALPETVRVKLSSEEAGGISITRVVVQELAVRDLVEHLLGVVGKDEARIRELLLRGSVVSGASRFRWAGWETDAESLRGLLATFPDDDPSLPFAPDRCVRTILRGPRQPVEIPREAAARKGVFQRGTFWDLLMSVMAAGPTVYSGYSYRERADRYSRELSAAEVATLRAGCANVAFTRLRDQIATVVFTRAELHVTR